VRYAFDIEGRPVPQGSMVASYNRKQGVARVHHQQGEALAMWRGLIRVAARAEGITIPSVLPIRIAVVFGMPRPKHHMRLRGGRYVPRVEYYYERPAKAPDIDKLLRGVLDALTGIVYVDDAQVVEVMCAKIYADSTHIEVSDESIPSVSQTLGIYP